MTTPHIIAIAGPSLSGKSEFAKRLKDIGANELVSITTRPQRVTETDGESYHFVNKDTFENLLNKNEIMQQSFLHNEYYGMATNEVIEKSTLDNPLIWVIAPQSIPQIEQFIKEYKPDWKLTKCLIFNSPEVLVERLLTRYENDNKSDKEHYAKRFINLIGTEIPEWTSKETQAKFDYVINNFSQETENDAITELLNLIKSKDPESNFWKNGLDIYSSRKKIKP